MASMSHDLSSRRPKLDRRNAKKIVDYDASTPSPSTPATAAVPKGSPLASFDKGACKSFRILGHDSKEQTEKICEVLGIPWSPDALGISQEAWDAEKSKKGSLHSSLLDDKPRSLSVNEPSSSFHGGHDDDEPSSSFHGGRDDDELNKSLNLSLAGDRGLSNRPSSQHDHSELPQVRDSSRKATIDGFHKESRGRYDRQNVFDHQNNDSVSTYGQHTGNAHDLVEDQDADASLYHSDRRPTSTMLNAISSAEATARRHDNLNQGYGPEGSQELLSKSFGEKAHAITDSNQAVLLPPPDIRSKPDHLLRSTQEFNENMDHRNKEVKDDDHTSASTSEGPEANPSEDGKKEHIGFVAKVLLQHSNSAKEQIRAEDGGCLAPQTPQGNANTLSAHSWRKLDPIGSGSFGTVYEALSEDGMYFAVKEVSLGENDAKAQQCVTQLEQEIEFLSKFHHENIVHYLGTQKEPDKLYIFLELVTKGSLSSLYQKHPLFDSQIRSYTRQILNGLKYLHDRRVMHRDIKCANILVDVSGKIKLADFGLAKQISQLDELKSCKGSAYWMAPEVINPRQTYSLPADIWSLGCTVLEMKLRGPPFGNMEWHQVLWKVGNGEGPPIPADLSDEAKDFVKKCLEVKSLKRPSASELLNHPFVQYTGGTGFTPRNSFTEDFSTLHVITESGDGDDDL